MLAELGVEAPQEGDITLLKHVRSQSEKARAKAEEIGQRVPCKDFERFRPLFETVQEHIKSGLRKTILFSQRWQSLKKVISLFFLGKRLTSLM